MTKRFAFIGAVIVVVITITVFFAVRTIGKTQTIAVPAPQVETPTLVQTVEPAPVQTVEPKKPDSQETEKSVLIAEDPGSRLLVDGDLWSGFRIDPDNRGFFSAFRSMQEGTLVYAPSDGYITRESGDNQPDVIFVPGVVPAKRNHSQRESGIRLFNLASNLEDYKFLKKGDLIGETRQDGLTFFESFDKTINFGFEAGVDLAKVLENFKRPTDQRQLLLLLIQESKKLNK